MATNYPTLPSQPQRTPPSAGPTTGQVGWAGLLAAIPGVLSAIPGPYGRIGAAVAPLASVPGQLLDYQATRAATEQENIDKELGITMLNDWRPEVARPAEYNIDVRVPYVAEGVRRAKAGAESTHRQVEDAAIRMGREGSMAGGQIADILDEIGRQGMAGTRDDMAALWENANREYINNKLRIGDAELQRGTTNQHLSGNRIAMMLQLLTGTPYGVTSMEGMLQNMREDSQFAQNIQQQERNRRTQQHMATQANEAALWGGGMSAAGSVGAAGVYGLASRSSGGGGSIAGPGGGGKVTAFG